MVIILCTCNYGVSGVDELPAHQHRDMVRLRIVDPTHRYFGEVIEMQWRDWQLNLSNPTFEAIERYEEPLFSIDWKAYARAL